MSVSPGGRPPGDPPPAGMPSTADSPGDPAEDSCSLLLAEIGLAVSRLAEAGVESPRADAELIAAAVHGIKRTELHMVPDSAFDAKFWADIARREAREPLQHITGRAGFRYLDLAVGPGVFVPRPETEVMTGWVIDKLRAMDVDAPIVVDLGTGSGAIALSVAQEVPRARVHAVEADPLARVWAERNVTEYVENVPYTAGRVMVHAGDFCSSAVLPELDGTVDCVVSNPPYIPVGAVVPPEVGEYDPPSALWSGADGLNAIRAVERTARRLLRPGGVVAVEHGSVQGAAVYWVFAEELGWRDTRNNKDLADRDRFVTASWPGPEGLLVMSTVYDVASSELRASGIDAAVAAVRNGDLVVLPTDTVYGIGADAFTPPAVRAMLAAKGRGRSVPSPVLVGTPRAAAALVEDMGAFGQDLIDEFWPGALTLVFRASPTLLWDIGETKGTVALRMPLHPIALEVLKQTGPMAVSSANRHGIAPATTASEAQRQLGEVVSVYLDSGPCTDNTPSTILDLTGTIPRVLREGAISVDRLRKVSSVITDGVPYPDAAEKPALPHPLEVSDTASDSGEPPSAGDPVS